MKKIDNLLKREPVDAPIFEEIDSKYLLNKYGPEGLYDLANMLMKVADKDVSDAIKDSYDVDGWNDGGCSTGLGGDQYDEFGDDFGKWPEGKEPGKW